MVSGPSARETVGDSKASGSGAVLRSGASLARPKSSSLALPRRLRNDVGRLDVPVHDAFGVGGIQRIGDLYAQLQHLLDGQRLSGDVLPQGLALHQFHDQELLALVFVNVMDGADVGVIQG